MPIYEYRRKTDGKVFEIRQSIKDDPLTVCPETGDPVEKIISRSSFHLKGSGWYTTDYKDTAKPETKSSGKAEAATKSSEAKSTESKSAESKTAESKPAETKKAEPAPAKKEAPKSNGSTSA